MSKVTAEMVDDFNEYLEEKGSVIRLFHNLRVVYIKTIPDDFLNSEDQIINPTEEFYRELEYFFSTKGLQLTYNNTGSCFWSH